MTRNNSGQNRVEYRTKLWKRSQNSHASTIPKQLLAIRGAPTPTDNIDVEVVWTINPESGVIEIEFEETSSGGDSD